MSANLTGVAAAAAVLAPALATAGTAAAALKIGLSGVGEAFKAAFADSSAEAASAASATRAVESAQRGLAGAQRALADARVQAAERVRDAQRAVLDAERDLADAQREARDVQADLNGARREAARALQDMNQQLAESRLDEREAVLRLKQAEDELKAAQKKPGVTPQELERLQLAYERAQLNLTEQRRDTKRLAADTKAANKAGVEGSEQVLSVKLRIADANRTVADRERALADAQAGVDKARQDGARQIADAQRAVAEAAQAVADAQAAAAAQTSKLDEAMAKLAPNARSFVNAIRGLAPAWDNMRLSVQNKLFEGLDTAVTGLAGQAIPILQRQLTVTAGIWNEMAKSAISAVSEMAKTGMLEQILQGANRAFAQLKDAPGQLLNSFAILTTAAQPAFERLMGGLAEGIASFEAGLARAFASGGLEQAINTAFGILQQFGQLLGNVFGVISEIFRAASDARRADHWRTLRSVRGAAPRPCPARNPGSAAHALRVRRSYRGSARPGARGCRAGAGSSPGRDRSGCSADCHRRRPPPRPVGDNDRAGAGPGRRHPGARPGAAGHDSVGGPHADHQRPASCRHPGRCRASSDRAGRHSAPGADW